MSERALILAFCAGLIPTALFSLCIISLLGSWCTALKGERDAWKLASGELEQRYVSVMEGLRRASAERVELEEALVNQMAHIARIDGELVELRRKHGVLQAVFAREKERIGRVVRDLKPIREAWISSRNLPPKRPLIERRCDQ